MEKYIVYLKRPPWMAPLIHYIICATIDHWTWAGLTEHCERIYSRWWKRGLLNCLLYMLYWEQKWLLVTICNRCLLDHIHEGNALVCLARLSLQDLRQCLGYSWGSIHVLSASLNERRNTAVRKWQENILEINTGNSSHARALLSHFYCQQNNSESYHSILIVTDMFYI